MSLFSTLNVGISGMFASRLATTIINHNIANANTPGYSRQTLSLSTRMPSLTPQGAVGLGVQIIGVNRNTDPFLERQLLDQTSLLGSYATIDMSLTSIEDIMGSVDNDRIGDALNSFFDSWGDLDTPTLDAGDKQAVVSAAESLALQLREVDGGLARLEDDSQELLERQIGHINSIIEQVGQLNGQILRGQSSGNAPNDLMDRRGALLQELSGMTRMKVHERSDGTIDVAIEGRNVVTRDTTNPLRLVQKTEGNVTKRVAVIGTSNDLEVNFEGGQLGGLLRTVNEFVPQTRAKMDSVARSLMDRVNELHRQGLGPAGTGIDFFIGTGAGDIRVNPAVVGPPPAVATGRSGESGDNELAGEIAALRDSVSGQHDLSITDEYNQALIGLATDRGSYQTLREGQQSIVESIYNRLESVRGVNIDEELTNLLQFQRTYEANARVISSVNEMLDTLINRMI